MRALAILLKVSPPAVSKAIREGRIHASVKRDARGRPRMLPDQAVAEFRGNTDAAKQRDPATVGAAVAAALQERKSDPQADDDLSLTAYRTEREKYQARQAKVDYEEATKKLVRADIVRAEVFLAFRTLRDRVMQAVDQVHADLAAETSPRKVRAQLHAAMVKALESAAGETEKRR